MNQDTLNKIKSYKNSKYVWCAVGGRCRFFDWHLPRRTFQGFDFLCGMCSGSNSICHSRNSFWDCLCGCQRHSKME